ncbi:MAG: hypothetical protein QXG40_08150 [Ignisphaera sp.]
MAEKKELAVGLLGLGAGIGASAFIHGEMKTELRKMNEKLSESVSIQSDMKTELKGISDKLDIPLSTLQELIRKAIREELRIISIYVDNELDQPVTVQVKANRESVFEGSTDVGSPFTVPAGSTDAITLTPDTSGWLPYITVSLVCSTAPASGYVTVYRIRSKDDQVKIVDALEIRDTDIHDVSTDPNKIFIVEW